MIQAGNRPMVLAIEDHPLHGGHLHDKLLASGHVYNNNSTSSSSKDTTSGGGTNGNYCNNWSAWSPIVDWDAFHGCQDDFHNLLDYSSMIENNQTYHHHDREHVDEGHHDSSDICNSGSSTGDTIMVDQDEDDVDAPGGGEDDFKGVRLVHLLMAAADALTGENPSRDLARVILVRLKELVTPSGSTNMERLAAYFTQALQYLLDGNGSGPTSGSHGRSHDHHHLDHHNPTDVVAAFQLLLDTTPYVKFGHFTANQAILDAVANDRRVHIVDYDITEGIQWSSLMQALVSRKEGPAAPHLRITAISRGGNGRRFMGTILETGRRLAAFAASIGLPFSFHQCRLDSDESFRPSALKLVKGEALIINCMLHLPHFSYRSPESIASFLSGSKSLNPRLITLVEEEVGPTEDGRFKTRFMDTLHQYSSIYDSLEAGFPMQNRARALVERVFLGPRIADSVSRIYRATGRGNQETGFSSWGEWLGTGGCRSLEMSFANHCQARLLLGLFNDGYRVENMAHNKLVLGWKSKRLLSASIWASCSTSSSSDSDP